MAALIEAETGADVTTTATRRGGEFSVWVDGKRVLNKFLIFKPKDEKVLASVRAVLP